MSNQYSDFQDTVWDYYRTHGRDLPWRQPEIDGSVDPYKILVSEIMLQQTQATRVIPKYEQFLAHFPDVNSLANASQQAVLVAWSGLGYNRRARFLHQAAQAIVSCHAAAVPQTEKDLMALPGVGINTARAILTYAFNQRAAFIETNIRTVYIYHFFEDQDSVQDADILKYVTDTLDTEHPREWFWALMDYGTHLKATIGNLSRNSKHYTRQSAFKGSKRQIRGMILKLLTTGPKSYVQLSEVIQDPRLNEVILDLVTETLIVKEGDWLSL